MEKSIRNSAPSDHGLSNCSSTHNLGGFITNYSYSEIEPKVISFWEQQKIYPKLKEKNKDGKKFYFLQGPPYTNGRIHIGHAWNNTLKDQVMRYERMKGLNVWDRGGYDMHGLPTENKVQEMLKLKTKKDIEKHGVEPFIKECIKFSSENALIMNKDLWRLGVWMDHENAYWPIKNSFMSAEWWLIKKAEEHKRLYKKEKVMQWCASCETALAKHELEYETLTEKSIFLKFRIVGSVDKQGKFTEKLVEDVKGEKLPQYLIIWTTTPWTIPFNLAVMVNPEIEYVKARVDNEIWYVAKALSGIFIGAVANKQFQTLAEIKGEELFGLKYEHPLCSSEIKGTHTPEDYKLLKHHFEEIGKKSPRLHTVLLTKEYCDASAGSGLVHCAPGCGPEDYEVGEAHGIPPFNKLDERGMFADMGVMDGLVAKKDDKKFIELLDSAGALVATNDVEHEYAHCWRCHHPVVFRATVQWFMKTEDVKEKILQANKSVTWVPKKANRSFESWIENLRDNSITRQRYWGTPVPIWECEDLKCNKYVVIGSSEELKQKSITGKIPDDLHRPWIDSVQIKCECEKTMHRVEDVLDVWLDSGTVSWNCLDYPENKNLMKEYFPADLILEATEQARLWFSMLMISSFISMDKPCYKAVYNHGMILDYQGMKMSKSQGNIISPYEVIDKYGADVLRYYMCEVPAGENINFSWEDIKIKQRHLGILWNVHKYLMELCNLNNVNPDQLSEKAYDANEAEEAYILSKLNTTIKKVTLLYEEYMLDETIAPITELFLELSRTYIQLIREKSASGTESEKQTVIKTIYTVLLESIKMLSTICPFVTEAMYQNIKSEFGLKEESVHLLSWPSVNENFVDTELETQMEFAKNSIQGILNCRERAAIGVRWPLLEVVIVTSDDEISEAVKQFEELIKRQTNIKEIIVAAEFGHAKINVSLNTSSLGKDFGAKAPKILSASETKNPVSIYHKIKQDGKYPLNISSETIYLTEAHLIIERELPKEIIHTELKGMEIYLNTKVTKELESEGFAREIVRRIQQSRKQAKLEKQDEIELHIMVDEEFSKELNLFLKKKPEYIQTKAGARKFALEISGPGKKYANTETFTIKDKKIEIYFEKI